MTSRFWVLCVTAALLAALAGCSQSNSGDPQAEQPGTSDTDRFWIFPNPNKDPATGVYQSNDAAYAQAYYAAIDPGNTRATLDGFKATNGFGTTVAGTEEVAVVFRDARDLGYGRRLTVRYTTIPPAGSDATGHTVAAFVENYQVVPFAGADYTSLNVEAAVIANRNYHVGTNAIEYSVAPNGQKFTKFYTYSPSGQRLLTVNLDGRGQKAMPSVCINCHGGRADPLFVSRATATPTVTFPNGGNTRAHMQPIQVDSVEFFDAPGYRRADQEESLRKINYAVFCTHPYTILVPPAPAASGVDTCRPRNGVVGYDYYGNNYQGAAGDLIKSWYSSGSLNTPSTSFSDSYVPTGWVGNESLYNNVVAPYCRVCHQLRGTENQRAIDFTTYDIADVAGDTTTLDDFRGYADRIKAHVFDRGNMPLGLIIYREFWESNAPEQLADWLVSINPSLNPARVGGGSTGKPVQPVGLRSDPAFLAAAVSNTPDYSGFNYTGVGTTLPFNKPTVFANIKAILQDLKKNPSKGNCTDCHIGSSVGSVYSPPIGYNDYDRDGDTPGTPLVSDVDDDYEFYKALRARVNLTDFLASPLLRKPFGNHHGGADVLSTSATTILCNGVFPNASCAPFNNYAEYSQAVYDTFLDWIQHGAPYSYTGTTPNF